MACEPTFESASLPSRSEAVFRNCAELETSDQGEARRARLSSVIARAVSFSRRQFLALGPALAVCSWSEEGAAAPGPFYVLPFGTVPETEHRTVRDALVARYGVEVRILPAHAAPRAAWYAPRRRHRAEVLLDFLDERLPADGAKILGLSHTDISTSKPPHPDWGILGLANIAGKSAVVSSFRCRRRARNAAHALERLAKVAVHEVGHALGLPHCTDAPDCLMRDAGGSVLSLDGENDLCSACRARLAARGWVLHG